MCWGGEPRLHSCDTAYHLLQGPKTQASQKILEKLRAGPGGAVIILERGQKPSAFIPSYICKEQSGQVDLQFRKLLYDVSSSVVCLEGQAHRGLTLRGTCGKEATAQSV